MEKNHWRESDVAETNDEFLSGFGIDDVLPPHWNDYSLLW